MTGVFPNREPSLPLSLMMADLVGAVPLRLLDAVWDGWIEPAARRRRLKRLESTGLVEPAAGDDDGERILRLTEAGRLAVLGGRDPEQRWGRPWDGRWRMVLFDVPEEHRSKRIRLQRQLRRAWFGYLQDSVWVSPDPLDVLETWVRPTGIDLANLSFLEARPCVGSTDADIVKGSWSFTRVNQLYGEHAAVLRDLPSPQASGRARGAWLKTEWQAWQRALEADPLLPEVLLPSGYRGRRALEARRARLGKLLGLG